MVNGDGIDCPECFAKGAVSPEGGACFTQPRGSHFSAAMTVYCVHWSSVAAQFLDRVRINALAVLSIPLVCGRRAVYITM